MANSMLVVLLICFITCPFLSLCHQREGESCRADLRCDRKAGLHCSPKPNGVCQACGVNNRKDPFDTRIVGGRPADPKAWPWMAGLTRKDFMNSAFCGGTLITDRHVLTAAHCLNHFAPAELMVRLGEYDFAKDGDNSPMDFEIEKVDIHEKYDNVVTDNDIAVITLKTEVRFNEFIWPACLPSPGGTLPVNKIGFVAGWGTKYFEGPLNTVLHEAAVKVWNQADCTKAYAIEDRTITDNMMCCGWAKGGIDSCHGDSGGPFMIQDRATNKWFLFGIVSWGRGCASPNLPGVYAKVDNYLDWIESHTKSDAHRPPAVTAPESQWGTFEPFYYCAKNKGVNAINVWYDHYDGIGNDTDDVGVAEVEIVCSGTDGIVDSTKKQGLYDSAATKRSFQCPSGTFINAVKFMHMPFIGGENDDAAMVGLAAMCNDRSSTAYPLASGEGTTLYPWTEWQACDEGFVICGFSLKIDPDLGDNTNVNGMATVCCLIT